ncbi:unnamed protein product [Blepharisma stoltei]|uniref:Uncharacterized protein n=1 Tax=Blepharisma stoltei TaxID=1481888 RepID=A0AAU9ICB5_9CILI|nr:unnamed protein product [Blepharisma stoltei]
MSIAKPNILSQMHLFHQYQLNKSKMLKNRQSLIGNNYKSLPLLESASKKPKIKSENARSRSKSVLKSHFNGNDKTADAIEANSSIEKLPIFVPSNLLKPPIPDESHLSKMRHKIKKAIGNRQKRFPSVKLKSKSEIYGKQDQSIIAVARKIVNSKESVNNIVKGIKNTNNQNYASHNTTNVSISAKEFPCDGEATHSSVSDFEDDVYFKSIYN